MKTPLLFVTTGVLCIAIGFVAGRSGAGGGAGRPQESGPRAGRSAGAETRQAPSRAAGAPRKESGAEAVLSDYLKGRPVSQISAEELYTLMKPEMTRESFSDPLEATRMAYQCRLLASRLPLDVIEDVLEIARADGMRGSQINMLFSGFAGRNWKAAMEWAEKQPDAASLRKVGINRLSLTDPAGAAALHQKELLSGNDSSSWDSNHALAENFAKLGQAEFFRFLDELPSGSQPNLISTSLVNLPKEEVAAYMTEVQKRVNDGKIETWWMGQVIDNMARHHPAEFRKWLENMQPGAKRAEAEVRLASSLSRNGTAEEVDGLLRSALKSSAGREKEFVISHVRTMVSENPDLAEKLVKLLPEGEELTRKDVQEWRNYGSSRPDTFLDVAKYFRSPDEQAAYLVESLNSMGSRSGGGTRLNAKDFEIVSNRLRRMDLPAETLTQAEAALESARTKSAAESAR